MGIWRDVLERRKNGDKLMQGGKNNNVTPLEKWQCPRCNSKYIMETELSDKPAGECIECGYTWLRRIG